MKCDFVGLYGGGCDREAVPGTKYCHAHRQQGPAMDTTRVIYVGCSVVGLLIILAMSITCAIILVE